eukprot:6212197-Pleurochrysis_carterae.AAC.2
MMVQVHEDPSRVVQQSAGGTAHSAAQHAHRVRHVGACLSGAIQVDVTLGCRKERSFDVLRQLLSGRRLRSAEA